MDEKVQKLLNDLLSRVQELEQVQGVHRTMISQHQSALKTVATIMERGERVDATL